MFQSRFKGIDVHPDDSLNIVINHEIDWSNKIDEPTYFKINGIEYDIDFKEVLRENKTEHSIFRVRGSYSSIVSFFKRDASANRSILIRIRESDFSKLVNSRIAKNEVLLQVTCKVDYEQYLYSDEYFLLRKCDRFADIFVGTHEDATRINLSEAQFSMLLSENRFTERIMLEMPFDEESPNSDLIRAIKSLQLAANGFKEGNYEKTLINTRNAVFNYLTELKTRSVNKKERVLKSSIIDSCISKCPDSDKKIYKDVLGDMSKVISYLVNILSKFIHIDQGNIIKVPFGNDLEVIYFSLSLIARYLSRLTVYYK